jgi:hypothetical protein
MRTRILIKNTILLIEMAIYLVVVVVSTNVTMLTDDRFQSRAVRRHVM